MKLGESIVSRQANSHRLGPLKESPQQSSEENKKKKKPSPYSIPQTTFSGSHDRITVMPISSAEIEARSDMDSSMRDPSCDSKLNNIRVVTRIGIETSANPKLPSGKNGGALETDQF